jgi:PAB1-binding protein PBP1
LLQDILAALLIGLKVFLQNIRKKEVFDDREEDKEFDCDQKPEFFTQPHSGKPVTVETVETIYRTLHGKDSVFQKQDTL